MPSEAAAIINLKRKENFTESLPKKLGGKAISTTLESSAPDHPLVEQFNSGDNANDRIIFHRSNVHHKNNTTENITTLKKSKQEPKNTVKVNQKEAAPNSKTKPQSTNIPNVVINLATPSHTLVKENKIFLDTQDIFFLHSKEFLAEISVLQNHHPEKILNSL